MKYVELLSNRYDVTFKHEGREFDSIQYQYTRGKSMYFSAINNGIKYRTISKVMKFNDDGSVYISFGKVRLIIGSYKEVA